MIIQTEVDFESGNTTVRIDLGDKIFSLKVNLREIRNKLDLASGNILIQKASEAIAHAIGVDIKIEDRVGIHKHTLRNLENSDERR